MSELQYVIEQAQGAENILVPKGEAREKCTVAFQEATGIEIPDFKDERLSAMSEGRTFWLVKTSDIPDLLIRSPRADIGVTGTDARLNAQRIRTISGGAIGKEMCRFSVLADDDNYDQLDQILNGGQASEPIRLATGFPRMLSRLAAWQGLPLEPDPLYVNGSVEIMPDLLGLRGAADLVETGETALQNGKRVVRDLEPIFPEILTAFTYKATKAGQ